MLSIILSNRTVEWRMVCNFNVAFYLYLHYVSYALFWPVYGKMRVNVRPCATKLNLVKRLWPVGFPDVHAV